jgi:predicted house-cleaning noncanonical NTP pyrophosphatase (MazG superfamily)
MVQAFPASVEVKVDSVWGFPDGLNYLPYDSYFVADRLIQRRLSHKSHAWVYGPQRREVVEIGKPRDWQPTLNHDELTTLARWAIQVADAEHSPVQLMALARVRGVRGVDGCIPWFYTTNDIPAPTFPSRVLVSNDDVKVVESMDDLSTADTGFAGYLLRPRGDLIRSKEFLRAVAEAAMAKAVPVMLEGSLLGHAYYILRRAGVTVVPIKRNDPSPRVVRHQKLVRDRIPAIVASAGGLARVAAIPREEGRLYLGQKLIEEALEAWDARLASNEELLAELADVREVLVALATNAGISLAEVDAKASSRRANRGAFRELLFLEETSPLRDRARTATLGLDGDEPGRHIRRDGFASTLQVSTGERTIEMLINIAGDPSASVEIRDDNRGVPSKVRMHRRGTTVVVTFDWDATVDPPGQLRMDFIAAPEAR